MATRWIAPPLALKLVALAPAALVVLGFAYGLLSHGGGGISPYATRWS